MEAKKNEEIKRSFRLIVAGGGTGGHIFPAIAIANAIRQQEPQTEILFVGARGKMEMEKVPQAGYPIRGLDIAGFNRSSLIKNINLPFKLVKSFFQVRRIFRDFRPDAALGVGGYSSFPVLRLAQSQGIPTFIHESNAFAGKSNILLGKKATRVFVASDGMEKFFPAGKIFVSGNPVRENISGTPALKEEALAHFGLQPGPVTLLSVGGSLGALSINESLAAGIRDLNRNGLQVIWQTGKPFLESGKAAAQGIEKVWVTDFISRMDYAYAAADLVVSRAGAMAIAELAVVKKPAILVPYPFAAEDHQTVNARNLEQKGAALMVPDRDCRSKLIPAILELASDGGKRNLLSDRIGQLALRDADKVIAREILKTLRGG